MNDLLKLKNDLVIKKMKLDKFFSMYLEKFERKMDPDNTDTQIWKLYKAKLKEYGDIAQQLRNTDYYIKREQQYV